MTAQAWPDLPWTEWQDTCAALHMWTQVVGKVRLALTPPVNHWWHVPLYLTCRGLTTSPIPYGACCFQMDFDFLDHRLDILVNDGRRETIPLQPCSVAHFSGEVMGRLRALGLEVSIWAKPVEVVECVPFHADHQQRPYDAAHARKFWQVLLQTDRVLKKFRGRFLGKASPVHFFWGSFDLAASRFSGRPAPAHGGGVPNLGDWVVREAYSHEVCSCGFWPGNGGFGQPAFYCYAYPEPPGFAEAAVTAGAYYSTQLREFVLPYETVRTAAAPDATLLDFLQSTYAAAADRGHWDRAALERPYGPKPG
jgi:hypothetical protein